MSETTGAAATPEPGAAAQEPLLGTPVDPAAKPVDPAAKSADPAAKSADPAKPAAPEAPVVPEKYEFKVPDGVTLDEAVIGQFSEVAKGLKLTQEQAQALVDFQVSRDTSTAQAQQDSYTKMIGDWATEAAKDPVLGGAAFRENVALAQKAVDHFGGPELNKVLRDFGWGNHPALLKAFHGIGKMMSDPAFVTGGSAAAGPAKDPITTMFPLSSGQGKK